MWVTIDFRSKNWFAVVKSVGSTVLDQPVRYEESYILGCGAVRSGRILPTFQWNILPPSSGSNSRSKASKKQASKKHCLYSSIAPEYTVSHPKRLKSSQSPPWRTQIPQWIFILTSLVPVLSSWSGTGSTQPRENNWGATWKKSSGWGLENRD
jgi:hypothetical protein